MAYKSHIFLIHWMALSLLILQLQLFNQLYICVITKQVKSNSRYAILISHSLLACVFRVLVLWVRIRLKTWEFLILTAKRTLGIAGRVYKASRQSVLTNGILWASQFHHAFYWAIIAIAFGMHWRERTCVTWCEKAAFTKFIPNTFFLGQFLMNCELPLETAKASFWWAF
jgi:hypothetical protein